MAAPKQEKKKDDNDHMDEDERDSQMRRSMRILQDDVDSNSDRLLKITRQVLWTMSQQRTQSKAVGGDGFQQRFGECELASGHAGERRLVRSNPCRDYRHPPKEDAFQRVALNKPRALELDEPIDV